MKYYISLLQDGTIHTLTKDVQAFPFQFEFETDIDLEQHLTDLKIIDTKIVWNREYWIEPTWIYRIFVTNNQLKVIADFMPEYLVQLNTEPRNPKYTYSDGAMVYLNTVEDEERAALESIGIIIEHKPE